MQTNFEKQVKEKLHDFQLAPSNLVWEDIADAINKPKKRRVGAWWFFAAGSVVLGAGLWMAGNKFFPSEKNNVAKSNKTILSAPVAGSSNSSTISRVTDNNRAHASAKIDYSLQASLGTAIAINLKGSLKEYAEASQSKPLGNTQLFSPGGNDANLKDVLQKEPEISLQNPISNSYEKQVQINNTLALLNDDENKIPNSERKIEMPDLQKNISSQTASAAIIKNHTKKSLWSFLFDGGTTNTTDRNVFFKTSNPLVYHSGSASDTVKSMKPAYTGFHATAGIQYSLALSNRWTFYTGLQLSFLLNHQRTGIEVRQESEISNATDTLSTKNQGYVQIPYHYVSGFSSDNTNYATWLEAPVGFGYKINPRSKMKVELRGGASLAHMSTDKWLIPDGRYDRFYYCNPLTNNYIANLHEDIVVALPNHKIIGLQYQHSLTGLAKREVQPALYWSNISLYTTIPLK